MLSPLRFHYDSESFSLPVRLGLVNSRGTQDLLIHILARNQRYEVANYPNVTIPTNANTGVTSTPSAKPFTALLFISVLLDEVSRNVARHPLSFKFYPREYPCFRCPLGRPEPPVSAASRVVGAVVRRCVRQVPARAPSSPHIRDYGQILVPAALFAGRREAPRRDDVPHDRLYGTLWPPHSASESGRGHGSAYRRASLYGRHQARGCPVLFLSSG